MLAGHYVPQLAQLIYEKNKSIQNPTINFKGFMVNLRLDFYLYWFHFIYACF